MKAPDLIILDLGLPDGDGLELCDSLREKQQIMPILVLTARDSLMARVEGLSAGADDYMTKPLELPELLARVHALLRRQGWHGRGDTLKVGCLEADFKQRRALRDGRTANLTELEFKLHYLVRNSARIVTREELLTEVWEQSAQTRTRTVDVFISRLRHLIESNPTKPGARLRNVRGVGYQLTQPVRRSSHQPPSSIK